MQRLWPLTGRDEELAAVLAAMHRANGARGIVLSGAAGVGKTRLAREAIAAAEREQLLTRWLTGTASSRELPMGAFAALVDDLEGDPFRLFQRTTKALLDAKGYAGVAIAVDDAHLLDDLSAALLHQIVLQGQVTVIITLRTGDAMPDALAAIWKDSHLDRVEVQPLSERETGTLLEQVLGGPLDAGSAGRLFALTKGNPLYLRHVVEGEVHAGRLEPHLGVWWWTGGFEASHELVSLVDRAMLGVPAPVGEVLDLLAVGGSLGVDVLASILGSASPEAAEASGIVVVDRTGGRLTARPGHPLYGEVRLARIGQLKARRLRTLLAEALLAEADPTPADLLRCAVLCLEADVPAHSDLYHQAARSACQLFDYPLAERLAEAAVEAGGGMESLLLLGYAQGFGNRADQAVLSLNAVRAQARSEAEMVHAVVPSAGHAFFMLGQPEPALELLHQAELATRDEALRGPVVALGSVFALCLGRPNEAIRRAHAALASPAPSPQAIVLAMWSLVGGLGLIGRASEIEPYGERAWTVGGHSYDAAPLRLGVVYFHLSGLRLAGFVHEAEQLARRRESEIDVGLVAPRLMCQALVGEAVLARGLVRSSVELLTATMAGLGDTDTSGWTFHTLAALTVANAVAGDGAAAVNAAERLESLRHPAHRWMEPDILLADAWASAAQGFLTEAIELAHTAAAWAERSDQIAHRMFALATAVRFGDRSQEQVLVDLASVVDGPRAQAAAEHAVGLTRDDGVALLRASRAFEAMGDQLSAADAAAQAALAYDRRGLHGSRISAAARAARLQEACEGARTPALNAAARPLPLTDREREIVGLAAQGLANREIADRLVVSVRTVEGHLYRAGAKLGTSSRTEFAKLLTD